MQDDKCRAPAEQVDHVMRLAEGGDQRDWDLLQSLCQPHHDAKTRRGRKAREDPSAMTEQHRGQRSLRPLPLLTLPLKQHDDAQDVDDELGGSEAHRADEDDDVDPPGIAEPAVETG